MTRILSTYVFIKRKLTPALIAEMPRSRRQSRRAFLRARPFRLPLEDAVREIAGALRDFNLAVHAVHAPTERDFNARHESAAPLSISDPERGAPPGSRRRDQARAGHGRADARSVTWCSTWAPRAMPPTRAASTPRSTPSSICTIFAKQRGVTIALENTPGELATPANLRQFIADTRLTDLRLCFDIGHAQHGRRQSRPARNHARFNGHRAHPRQSRPERRAPAALRRRRSIGKQPRSPRCPRISRWCCELKERPD